ncbi:MAG TPA: carboxylate-amine ligase [Ktedonobacteraceae bacterium]|jgi:carboxylate-amine ligase|nr:carboxylate-amine ligase [Ktedonobacteraceae bacterium]
MTPRFTLGVEEEFQIVDKNTGHLVSHIHPLLEKGTAILGEQIKAEMLQSAVETVSDVCPNIAALRLNIQHLRTELTRMLEEDGLAPISSGTHPMAHWKDQTRTLHDRYAALEEEYQDVGRSILIFGLHVHVGIDQHEQAIPLMNQVRTWLPHLLAISANSPFWCGRFSGLRAYRPIVWQRFPRSGIPELFASTAEFDHYVEDLVATRCIDDGKRIWWDVRPHPFFSTLEFRLCDMPGTLEDTMALAALCQALVAKLTWLLKHNITTCTIPTHLINENKWLVARYGLDAEFIDFVQKRRLSMRESIHELLDFVEDVIDDLGSRREINYLRDLLDSPQGTGADRQIAVYQELGSTQAVTQFLIEQTAAGLSLDRV